MDDRHPSVTGSYLAAAVIVGSVFGVSVESAQWVPGGLDAEDAARLRRIADLVVGEEKGRQQDATLSEPGVD